MRFVQTVLLTFLFVGLSSFSALAASGEEPAEGFPGPSHYLRGAYQIGSVLQTNDFLRGDNQSGEAIENFQSIRLEFGWQTDGSRDWHHSYNFPSYGIGLYGADYNNDEELGNPTSLYGFYVWPLHRGSRWRFNAEVAFGFTNDWVAYDPVNNPSNTAMGLGRSVHIEIGANAEYRLAERWALIGGITGTHFSNGGTQRPNHGLNQMGPILFVKYATDTPVTPPARRKVSEYPDNWDLTVTGSAGKRNLDLEFTGQDSVAIQFANESYFIGNLTVGMGKRFSCKSRYVFGLDLCYDQSVGDLTVIDGMENGVNATADSWDFFELAVFGGYEVVAHKTHMIVHLGYKIFYKDLPNRLPALYQRLGVKQFVYQDWFVGLNVRFHEIGSADNLEWTLGYKMDL
jgi:hypothetical protein